MAIMRMNQKPLEIIIAFLLVTSLSTFPSPAQSTNGNQAGDGPPTKLPEVVVTDNKPVESRPGWLQEEQTVGGNEQPEWTTRRRFSTTRVYVISPWQMEFEQWWKGKFLRDGKTEHLFDHCRKPVFFAINNRAVFLNLGCALHNPVGKVFA